MVRRRFPSIFREMVKKMREEMERFPFGGEEKWFEDPFAEMFEKIEESPEDLEEFITEEETPGGKVRKYGPFVYGFSYSKKPGEEPEIQEFGNIKSGEHGKVRPAPKGEREPLTEVVDLNGKFEITIEMPGVEKEEINLTATEEKMKVKTTGERKYRKEIKFEVPINPDKVDANFLHGCLTVEVEKKEEETDEGKEIEVK